MVKDIGNKRLLFIMITLVTYVVVGSFEPAQQKKVNCCIDGKVEKITAAECKEDGGKIVKDVKACKPVKKK